jgi:hypothetical protein
MNKKILLFSFALIIFSVFSCKTLKKLNGEKKPIGLEEIYDSMLIVNTNFSNLEIKFNLNFENSAQSLDLKGTLKIAKDSLIWITLSPGLGIEGVRVLCNKDSIYILNRQDKTLTKSDYSYIKKVWKIDVDFNSLQSIFIGEFFIYPNVSDRKKEFVSNFIIKNDSVGLEVYRKTQNNIENLLKINRSTFRITDYIINDISEMRNLSLNYSFNKLNEGNQFPKKIAIKSNNAGKFLNIDIDYTKILINSNPVFSFTVPASYTTVIH